jgi:hypothetical protein
MDKSVAGYALSASSNAFASRRSLSALWHSNPVASPQEISLPNSRETPAVDETKIIAALLRAGLAGLAEGRRVIVDVIEGRKGPEAAEIRLG